MPALILTSVGLAATLLPAAAFTVARSWLRQDRALRRMPSAPARSINGGRS